MVCTSLPPHRGVHLPCPLTCPLTHTMPAPLVAPDSHTPCPMPAPQVAPDSHTPCPPHRWHLTDIVMRGDHERTSDLDVQEQLRQAARTG